MTLKIDFVKDPYTNYKIVQAKFSDPVTKEEFSQFLKLFTQIIQSRIVFGMLVDASGANIAPVDAALKLRTWMKKNKKDIPGCLVGSAVIIGNKNIASLLNSVFIIQKPVSPNIITTEKIKAKAFIQRNLKLFKDNNSSTINSTS